MCECFCFCLSLNFGLIPSFFLLILLLQPAAAGGIFFQQQITVNAVSATLINLFFFGKREREKVCGISFRGGLAP